MVGERYYEGLNSQFLVGQNCPSGRVDKALAEALGVARTEVGRWLSAGYVRDGAGAVIKKSQKLSPGEQLHLNLPARRDPLAVQEDQVEDLVILAEDEHFVVIDKPSGVAAHPSLGWHGPTVLGALKAQGYTMSTSGAQERQGIVHRLDVGTSGVMVVAKTEAGYTGLKNAFRQRTTTKIYHALCQGLPDPLQGTIDAPIGRHHGHEWKFAVTADGREAITHYSTLEAYGQATLLRIVLETGRTHQIRVHFSAFGHPLAGDLSYGADPTLASELGLTRQWLHACQLSFPHPVSGEECTFSSSYAPDLQQALALLSEAKA